MKVLAFIFMVLALVVYLIWADFEWAVIFALLSIADAVGPEPVIGIYSERDRNHE